MNNFIIFSYIVACGLAITYAQGPSNADIEARQRGEKMARTCQIQEQVTEADFREFSMQRKPSSKSAKCFHACMMESIGLLTNGKLSIENSIKIMGQMSENNVELLKIVEEVSSECAQIEESDRCEMAFKIMTCTEEGMKRRHADMKKFLPRQQVRS